jgi:hypothetical protein
MPGYGPAAAAALLPAMRQAFLDFFDTEYYVMVRFVMRDGASLADAQQQRFQLGRAEDAGPAYVLLAGQHRPSASRRWAAAIPSAWRSARSSSWYSAAAARTANMNRPSGPSQPSEVVAAGDGAQDVVVSGTHRCADRHAAQRVGKLRPESCP